MWRSRDRIGVADHGHRAQLADGAPGLADRQAHVVDRSARRLQPSGCRRRSRASSCCGARPPRVESSCASSDAGDRSRAGDDRRHACRSSTHAIASPASDGRARDLEPEVAAGPQQLGRATSAPTAERLKFARRSRSTTWAWRSARPGARPRAGRGVAVIGNPNPVRGRHNPRRGIRAPLGAIEELECPSAPPTGQASLRDDIAPALSRSPERARHRVAGRNPMELMLAFASFAAGVCSSGTPAALRVSSRVRAAGSRGGSGAGEAWEKFGPGSEVQISQLRAILLPECYVATDADEKVLRQVVERSRRQHRRVDRLSALRRLFPTRSRSSWRWRGGDRPRQDPLGQLRRLYRMNGAAEARARTSHDRERGESQLLVT